MIPLLVKILIANIESVLDTRSSLIMIPLTYDMTKKETTLLNIPSTFVSSPPSSTNSIVLQLLLM